MSMPLNPSGRLAGEDPVPAGPTVTVGTFDNYPSAQRAVDFLADRGFPVEHVSIVGTDLRLVERVLGRLTVARATGAGALSGAWIGLLVGVLLGIFTSSGWLWVVLLAVLMGAVWGAIFGAVAHALTGGQRDFTSVSRLDAAHYAVMVGAEHAEEARRLLMVQH
jgi:hypothetical protein